MARTGAISSRRPAGYVDKILKGAKPAEPARSNRVRFEFIINVKVAKALGLTIPPSVLARATRSSMIENAILRTGGSHRRPGGGPT